MKIWIVVIFILILSSIFEILGKYYKTSNDIKQTNKEIGILGNLTYLYVAMFLASLAIFSFETGRDWENYIQMFNKAESMLKHGSVERGYIRINHLFKKFGLSYWTMRSALLAFCSFVLFRSFYKYSAFPCYTITLYFCQYFFSNDLAQTRQYIAMTILLMGIDFTKKKKLAYWIILIIIAMQFHVTAICAFPLYFTNRIKIKPWFVFVALIGCFLMTLFGLDLIWGIMEFISGIGFIPERILKLLDMYRNSDTYNKQMEYSSGMGLIARYFFYFLVAFLYYAKYKNNKIDNPFMLNFLIGILFLAMGRNFSQFGRIGNYYFLVGGGLFAYNILPQASNFFKKIDFGRVFFFICWIAFVILDFYKKWMGQVEYSYKTFLL